MASRNALEQALMDEIKQWTGTARENNVLGDNLELLRDSGSPGDSASATEEIKGGTKGPARKKQKTGTAASGAGAASHYD